MFLHLTIFLHSLLDFDFSYAVVFIIIVMIVAFADNEEADKNLRVLNIQSKLQIGLYACLLLFSLYLIVTNSIVFIGDKFAQQGKYDKAIIMYNINEI